MSKKVLDWIPDGRKRTRRGGKEGRPVTWLRGLTEAMR